MQNSQQITTEIEKAQERKAEVEAQLLKAREALTTADSRFVNAEIAFEELTNYQSAVVALERATGSIQTRLDGLAVDYKAAVKNEATEVFNAEIAAIEIEKEKLAQRFAKEAQAAEAAFLKSVEHLAGILKQSGPLVDRARASLVKLRTATDQAQSEKAQAANTKAFESVLRNWPKSFTHPLSNSLIQAVASFADGTGNSPRVAMPPPVQAAQPGNEAERRLRPQPVESEAARRLATQSAGGNEAAKRLGR